MSEPYPRDLRGYGRHPPDPKWPDEARVAVQFVINYEEGAENCILHGDSASESFLSDVVGARPLPGQRNMNVESSTSTAAGPGSGACTGYSPRGTRRSPCTGSRWPSSATPRRWPR